MTYKYCKTNKTLSFIYHQLYAHSFVFLAMYILPPQKEFFIYRNNIALFKKTLKNDDDDDDDDDILYMLSNIIKYMQCTIL